MVQLARMKEKHQKLWLKDSVKVLHCLVTLVLTHQINMIMPKKVQIIFSNEYVHTATRCQHWDRHLIGVACLRTKAHTRADGGLWQQDRPPSDVVYLLCQTAETHQAAIGSIKHVAGGNFTVEHAQCHCSVGHLQSKQSRNSPISPAS